MVVIYLLTWETPKVQEMHDQSLNGHRMKKWLQTNPCLTNNLEIFSHNHWHKHGINGFFIHRNNLRMTLKLVVTLLTQLEGEWRVEWWVLFVDRVTNMAERVTIP